MRKILFLFLLAVVLISSADASNISFSGRAGVYTASGSNPSMIYGVSALYNINRNLSARAAVETTTYTQSNGTATTYTPITVDLIYSESIVGIITPYVGAGLSYNSYSSSGVTTQTTGGQAEIGARLSFFGFSAGVEYRYLVPDLGNMSVVNSTYNAYGTGVVSSGFTF